MIQEVAGIICMGNVHMMWWNEKAILFLPIGQKQHSFCEKRQSVFTLKEANTFEMISQPKFV